MIKGFSRLIYFASAIIFTALIAILIAIHSIKGLESSIDELHASACNLKTLEQRLDIAYQELNKTINTLNSSNVIDEEIKKKAYKFTLAQTTHMAILKLKNGNDITNEINLINQFAYADLAIIANELKTIYNNRIPPNSFFISTITDLIYQRNNISAAKDQSVSAVDQIMNKFIKVEINDQAEERDILLFALHSIEHNNTARTLEIVKNLSSKYVKLKEIENSLQLKDNVNYLLHKIITQVLENV